MEASLAVMRSLRSSLVLGRILPYLARTLAIMSWMLIKVKPSTECFTICRTTEPRLSVMAVLRASSCVDHSRSLVLDAVATKSSTLVMVSFMSMKLGGGETRCDNHKSLRVNGDVRRVRVPLLIREEDR